MGLSKNNYVNYCTSILICFMTIATNLHAKTCNTGCNSARNSNSFDGRLGCSTGCCNATSCIHLPTHFEQVTSDNCIACTGDTDTSTGLEGFGVCQLDCIGKSIYIPRSVGANTARELVGWQSEIHRRDPKCWYISWAEVLGGSKSFKDFRIAQSLFGNKFIHFSGSQAAERNSFDWLADYFGLPTDYESRLEFNPTIDNIFLDTQLFIGLDRLFNGFYLRFHLPLVHTRWGLNPCEEKINRDPATDIPGCYMATEPVTAARSLREALSGEFSGGDIARRKYANISFCTLTETKFADLDIILGWDFYRYNEYQLGLYIQAVAPLGNRPNPRYLFSPIVGNAKHWELGAGLSGRLLLWQRGPDTSLNIYLEGNVTHMFKTRNIRTFDFCRNGLFSRYILLKQYLDDGVTYAGKLISAADFTTRAVHVSVPVKGDVSAKLSYRNNGCDFDIGYNFYGHHSERLCLDTSCHVEATGKYGIKGTEGVCYSEYAVNSDGTFGPFVTNGPLNSTQRKATIHHGAPTNNRITPTGVTPGDVAVAWNNPRTTGSTTGADIIYAFDSNPPVLVSTRDLNLASGTACEYATHKIFAYLGKTIDNCWCDKTAYFGIGAEGEFEALSRNERNSLNQWSLYFKGGISY